MTTPSVPTEFQPDQKYTGPVPAIKFLPVSAIERQEMDFRPEVMVVSAAVAKSMDFSEPVEVTAFRFSQSHDDQLPRVTVSDGHHRTAAAIQTGRAYLPVAVTAINAKGAKLNALVALSQAIEAEILKEHSADVPERERPLSDHDRNQGSNGHQPLRYLARDAINQGATVYSVVDGVKRLATPDGSKVFALPGFDADPTNWVAQSALELLANMEHAAHMGKICQASRLTGTDGLNGVHDIDFDPPVAVRVLATHAGDLKRWQGATLDPLWRIEAADPAAELILAKLKPVMWWASATSLAIDGHIEPSDLSLCPEGEDPCADGDDEDGTDQDERLAGPGMLA